MNRTLIVASLLSLTACSTYHVPESPSLSASATWAIMPLKNNSNIPLAAEKVEQILSTQLYAMGIHAEMYPKQEMNDLTLIFDNTAKEKHARKWLSTYPADYIITGSVEEWHYKSGLDGEPAVGITLEVKTAKGNTTLWRATGSRGGWGRESVSGTGQIVIEALLVGLNIEKK